jgi:RimJ/RimL family protein N-acetyltransferase
MTRPPPPELVVSLRPVEPGDLEHFFEDQRDPQACAMAGFVPRERPAFFAHWAKILGDPRLSSRTIVAAGAVAGNVVAWGPPEERLVGYWIAREWWGRGVATRALSAFIALETRRPLFALVAAHNWGSLRVLAKCGFVAAPPAIPRKSPPADGIEELRMKLP